MGAMEIRAARASAAVKRARLRVQIRDGRHLPELEGWWSSLTGLTMRTRNDEEAYVALRLLLNIGPDLELGDYRGYDDSLIYSGTYSQQSDEVDRFAYDLGPRPHLWLTGYPGIGLIDCDEIDGRRLCNMLLSQDEDGDDWFLVSRNLDRGFLYNWDRVAGEGRQAGKRLSICQRRK